MFTNCAGQSHETVSLNHNFGMNCAGQSHETVSLNHNFGRERVNQSGTKAESRTWVLPLTSRAPYHQDKPARERLGVVSQQVTFYY